MALWTGLGQAATVAQLVGADVGGLISMIMQAALTARQNRKECELLARRVLMIAQLLPHVQEPEAAQQLAGLGDTLRDAHELVMSCQGRSVAYQVVMAWKQAERFREVQSRIDSYLILFPVISHIGITRRLERIYNVLVQQDDSTRAGPSQLPQPSAQLQEVVPQGIQEFTLAEIMAATKNFSLDSRIDEGAFGIVYLGRLRDGRKVAVKRMKDVEGSLTARLTRRAETKVGLCDPTVCDVFRTELNILSRLQHKHIVRLLGSYVTVTKDKRVQATTLTKKKGLLTRRWKEAEQPEKLIVYEYIKNGSLFDHLHPHEGSSSLSPVTVSWKMRIDVLLGVARAIEHLHCHANPPIIHRDIKSANILLDSNWEPRLSDFGLSVTWDLESEESGFKVSPVVGTIGYLAPEYMIHGHLSPASDVYIFGVVMLEVLTGKKAYSQWDTFGDVPIVPDFLDRRPVPEPTPWQLQVLKRVVWTARCCMKLDAKNRLAISDVVANLEMAQELICRDEPGSVDEPGSFDEFPDSPRAFPDSPRATSDLESEALDEGR